MKAHASGQSFYISNLEFLDGHRTKSRFKEQRIGVLQVGQLFATGSHKERARWLKSLP